MLAIAQTAVVTLLGGAVLDRYMLPVLPILYAAFAVAASAWSRRVRLSVQAAMVTLFIVGWFWNPPVPFPYEDNLAMVDFVRLQQTAARIFGEPCRRSAHRYGLAAQRRPDQGPSSDTSSGLST